MGLLDSNLDSPEGQGLLAAALSLMGAQKTPGQRGGLGSAFADAGRQYMGARQQAAIHGDASALRQLQLGEMRRKAEQDRQMSDAARSAYRSPEQANAMNMGPAEDGGMLPQVRPGFDSAKYSQALYGIDPLKGLAFDQSQEKEDAPVKLGAGESLFSGKASGYKPLLSVPGKDAAAPSAVQEYQFAVGQGYAGTFDSWKKGNARAGASNVSVNTDNLGLKPKDRFEMEDKLRNDYTTGTKADQEIVSNSSDLINILAQPGSLKDQAAIYKFAKGLDPLGAVREADYAAVVKTAGGLEYVTALVNKAITGEQLSPKQRTEMGSLSASMAQIAQQRIANTQKTYSSRAKMYNLAPENVFTSEVNTPKPGKAMDSLPKTTPAERGRKIRDTSTGKILVSNGMSWTEVK